jgi:Leucine-rich repeat (LRR) protein
MKKIKIFLIVIVSMNINLFAQKDSTYTDLELAIQNPQNVKNLILKNKKLYQLPSDIGLFENLEILNLKRNKLTSLPSSIVNCKNLIKIDLSYNKFTNFPIILKELPRLQEVNLYHNELEYLPSEIGEFIKLEKLDLGENYLTELPAQIKELSNTLKELNLRLNVISLKHQKEIREKYLPNTKIYFSAPCNCDL